VRRFLKARSPRISLHDMDELRQLRATARTVSASHRPRTMAASRPRAARGAGKNFNRRSPAGLHTPRLGPGRRSRMKGVLLMNTAHAPQTGSRRSRARAVASVLRTGGRVSDRAGSRGKRGG
jgi:hypothetical protein